MNALKTFLVAVLFAAVTACGTSDEVLNENLVASDDPTITDSSLSEDQTGLTYKQENDECKLSVNLATFSKAAPQPLIISYSFKYFTKGDRVVLRHQTNSALNWRSGELPSGSGQLSIDIRSLAAGDYKLVGLLNTYVTDKARDCKVQREIVIRVK